MAKVHIDHILAQLGVGEMTSEEELEELVRRLREVDQEKNLEQTPN